MGPGGGYCIFTILGIWGVGGEAQRCLKGTQGIRGELFGEVCCPFASATNIPSFGEVCWLFAPSTYIPSFGDQGSVWTAHSEWSVGEQDFILGPRRRRLPRLRPRPRTRPQCYSKFDRYYFTLYFVMYRNFVSTSY